MFEGSSYLLQLPQVIQMPRFRLMLPERTMDNGRLHDEMPVFYRAIVYGLASNRPLSAAHNLSSTKGNYAILLPAQKEPPGLSRPLADKSGL